MSQPLLYVDPDTGEVKRVVESEVVTLEGLDEKIKHFQEKLDNLNAERQKLVELTAPDTPAPSPEPQQVSQETPAPAAPAPEPAPAETPAASPATDPSVAQDSTAGTSPAEPEQPPIAA